MVKLDSEQFGRWRRAATAILAVIVIAFSAGAYVTEFRLLPYRALFAKPFAYLRASEKRKAIVSKDKKRVKATIATGRVIAPATPEAYSGLTLLTFSNVKPSTAVLIDMAGNIVHRWQRPFSEIMPNRTPALPDHSIGWRYAHLFPNGDIIVNIKASGHTPDGCAMAKLDKDSNVIWTVADTLHHHFSVGEDGRIYGLTHQWRDTKKKPVEGAAFLPEMTLEDFVVVLSPEGKELARVSLLEAMAASGYRELFNSAVFRKYEVNAWDRLHPNDVEVITPAFAARHPFAKAGMVMVSVRELDALILVDIESRSVKWAMRGGWQRQHDPDLLENGNLLLYDNRGLEDKRGYSRILELEPDTGRVVWSYVGSAKDAFIAFRWGAQQRLPNGNTLIVATDVGNVFEVTAAGAMAWGYNDVPICSALRVTKDWIKFVPKAPTTRDAAADLKAVSQP